MPTIILATTLCVQQFSEMVMKRKMILGDEEYKEPNKILWSIILFIAFIAIVLSFGFYLMLINN